MGTRSRSRLAWGLGLCAAAALGLLAQHVGRQLRRSGPVSETGTFPHEHWEERHPELLGLDAGRLDAFARHLGGEGVIVRRGYLAHAWGDASERSDVASVVKTVYTFFLQLAVAEGRLASVDERVVRFAPCLDTIDAELGHKDRDISFRHLANQTSGYGMRERPGEAFGYGDRPAALLADALFLGVWGAAGWSDVDEQVLEPRLGAVLGFQDAPTLLAFGTHERPGRLAISVRDLARFGLLFLREGGWDGRRVLPAGVVRELVGSPLPNSIPRTAGIPAETCPGQRSLGSPDPAESENQTDHLGSYSWMWWTNGVDRGGRRTWPDAPLDTFLACGHQNCRRALVVLPGLDAVLAWNGTRLHRSGRSREETVNDALLRFGEAVVE